MRGAKLAAICAALVGLAMPAAAQTGFPQRAIKLEVPFAAGGNADIVARLIGSSMSEQLGQQVVIETRTGSGSVVASDYVAHATPDGYTLLITSIAHAVNPALYRHLPFDPVKDFQPIALVNRVPELLVVNPKLGVTDVAGLLERLRAEPGKHSYGSGGNGTAEHLAGALFVDLAKLQAVHVPYRGGAAALNDLLGSQISFIITPVSGTLGHVKGGSLLGLAVSTAQRVPSLPDRPTIAEAGVPGYDAYTWNAIYAPAGTPRPVVDRLNAAINHALDTPAIAQRLRELGNEPTPGSTPESLAKFLADEMAKWLPIVKASGVTPD